MSTRIIVAVLAVCPIVSCSSVEERWIDVEAVNAKEEPIPCVVYQGDMLILNEANDPVVTPAKVKADFSNKRGVDYRSVKLGVRPVEVDEDGNVARGLQTGEDVPYLDEYRSVRENDRGKQLFILRRNRFYSEAD